MNKIKLFLFILLITSLSFSFGQSNFKKDRATEVSTKVRNETAIFLDGLRAFYSNNYREAEYNFRTVIANNPVNDAAYFMLSRIRENGKDYTSAEYYINEAIKIDKKNIWYVVKAADIADKAENYKQSSKLWEEVCKVIPDNENYLFALSDSYIKQRKYADFIKICYKIEKVIGLSEEITEYKKQAYLEMNDIKGAVKVYSDLIAVYPHEVSYYVKIASIYLVNNMPDAAFQYLKKATDINKNDPFLQLEMYNYYIAKNKTEEAIKFLSYAFKNENVPPLDALNIISNLIVKSGNSNEVFKKSIQLLEILSSSHPDSYEIWLTLGTFQFEEKNYKNARVSIEKALYINQSDYMVWSKYIDVLSKLEDYKTISNCGEEILEYFPSNAELLYCLGLANIEIGATEIAISYLNQASMYAFDTYLLASIYELIGDAYSNLNNNQEALKNYNLALKKGSNSKKIKDKIDKLQK